MNPHDSIESRLRRQAANALPGPAPALGARIRAAVRREATSAPRPRATRTVPVLRPLLLLAAAAVFAGLGLWQLRAGSSAPEPASSGRSALAPLDFARLEGDLGLFAGELRLWVDQPLLREVQHWRDTGARAVRTYSELVPAPLRARGGARPERPHAGAAPHEG